ncbi:MAG: DUF190 domain-containing protein [Burkholderiaceae bacterium]
MTGYLVTFFTRQDRRHGGLPVHEWLMRAAQQAGIRGTTALMASEGTGRHGIRHSAHFFELADQPVEVQMAATEQQAKALFRRLEDEGLDLFYVKTPVEFGVTGRSA